MASIFSKDPSQEPPESPYAKNLIEKEIGHLKKPKSTRQSPSERATTVTLFTFLAICALLGLYAMDPFIFAWKKDAAIRAYLYLSHYDTDNPASAKTLATCGILSAEDVYTLDNQQGDFQTYFATRERAEQTAAEIEGYMDSLRNLQAGKYDQLDTLGKVRWVLFFRIGFIGTPTQWSILNPTVGG